MANASDSDSEDWRFDPSRADQKMSGPIGPPIFYLEKQYLLSFHGRSYNRIGHIHVIRLGNGIQNSIRYRIRFDCRAFIKRFNSCLHFRRRSSVKIFCFNGTWINNGCAYIAALRDPNPAVLSFLLKKHIHQKVHVLLVDAKGVEPSTSAMRMQHSPN